MNSNHSKRHSKLLVTSLLLLLPLIGIYFIDTQGLSVDANKSENNETQSTLISKPAHSQIYKIGTEANFQDAFQAANLRKQTQHAIRKKERHEQTKLAEKKAEEEKAKEALAAKESEQRTEETSQKEVQTASENQASSTPANQATATSTTNSVSNNGSSNNTASNQSQTQPAPKQNTQVAPAPRVAPQPAQPAIGSNKIGINGIYKSYANYGAASTDQLQGGIDAGQIVAGITSFNGNDGQTTYFGGHNPGVMNFMAANIYNGAIITITDSSGTPFKYQMIDKVDVDVYGEGVLQSIGRSAIDIYMYGANTESILIQFCNTSNNLMSFWYGVRI